MVTVHFGIELAAGFPIISDILAGNVPTFWSAAREYICFPVRRTEAFFPIYEYKSKTIDWSNMLSTGLDISAITRL